MLSTFYLHRAIAMLFATALLLGALPLVPARSQPSAPPKIHLPLLRGSPQPTLFGIEMASVSSERGLDLVLTSGTRWVRRNGLLWKEIEPVEGAGYRWDSPSVQLLEREMIDAARNGLHLVLVVRGSPRWATAPNAADCAPVTQAKTDAFVRFVSAAVERYSKPPYNVHYWEIGNEPDAMLFADNSVFGCWGVPNDPYYGGEAYGRVLNSVYAAAKAVNPKIKVLNGGLLLDRPYNPADAASLSGRFFEGMLRVGAGNSFDILSFHTYAFFRTPGYPELGLADDWRVPYLRQLMQAYNVPPKPLIRSETALLCIEVTPECRWSQADYVGRSFARSLRDGLLANIWYVYDNDSYHNTALIEPGDVFVPRPAYFAYRHVAQLLSSASYSGVAPGAPNGVEAYLFERSGEKVIAYWTDTGAPIAFGVPVWPGATATCSGRDGGAAACGIEAGRLWLVAGTSPGYAVIR